MQRIDKDLKPEKYYLINTSLIFDIIIELEYKIIKDKFEINNIQENDEDYRKKILLALKSLSKDEINNYSNKNINKRNCKEQNFEPEKISVNYTDYSDKSLKSIIIFDNFELFEKEIIELFIDDIDTMNNYYFDCIMKEEKIIINYPDNLNKNENKYISVIGNFNHNDNIFETEYILIFNDKDVKKIYE